MDLRKCLTLALSLVIGASATADPMDLTRLEARWVAVEVVSASGRTGELGLSAPALARYEVGPSETQRTVTVPGSEVERAFFADRSPVDGSFSDFVWVFDAATGEVLSASLTGLVDELVRIGPVRTSARVSLVLQLSTRLTGGYRPPRELAGRTFVEYCPDPDRPGCTAVASSRYDPGSGRVRAHGPVCARWRSLRTLSYTQLGRARFRELDSTGRGLAARLKRLGRTARRVAAARSC